MSSKNNEAGQEAQLGKHAAADVPQVSKREQRRAEKAKRKAEKQAAKDARKSSGVDEAAAPAPADEASAPVPADEAAPAPVDGAAAPAPADGAAAPVPGDGAAPAPAAAAMPAGEASAPAAAAPAGEAAAAGLQADAAPAGAEGMPGFVPATVGDASQYSRYSYLDGSDAEKNAQVEKNRKRRRRRRAVAVALIVILCLVGVGGAAAYLYVGNLNKNLAGTDEKEAEEVKEVLTPAPVGDEPFYMLLMGCDDREGVEGARADTTILARLDPKNNVATLMSIPRDTAIDIPGYGTQKFNAAYALNGPSGTIEAASELCGVPIAHYAEVHFEALISIIDYIGGVDVDVPIPIDDVDAGGKLDAGYQHLNGEQAMIFARSRSYANGDFQRTTSQRLLIEAAVDKVMSMPPTELPGLLMKVSQCMTTDFTVQQLLGLAMAFQDEPDLVMYSALVPSTTADIEEISYVVTDVALLQEMMAVIDEGGDPATVVPDDYTVTTSEQAREQGIEVIVNYGDDAPDEGAYQDPNYADYYGYDPGYTGYTGYYDTATAYADNTIVQDLESVGYSDYSYDDAYVDYGGDAGYSDGYADGSAGYDPGAYDPGVYDAGAYDAGGYVESYE